MNLLSNTNFGIYLKTLEISNSCYKMLRMNFDSFVSKKLKLGMFVPCDEEGNVLKEPDMCFRHDEKLSKEYQQAKERCLFEGFRVEEHEKESFSIRCENNILNVMWNFSDKRGWFTARGISTIEDLVKYDLTLTKTAQKQIGL